MRGRPSQFHDWGVSIEHGSTGSELLKFIFAKQFILILFPLQRCRGYNVLVAVNAT